MIKFVPIKISRRLITNTKMSGWDWSKEKEKFISMPIEQKRSHYAKQQVSLDEVLTWKEYCQKTKEIAPKIDLKVGHEIKPALNSILCEKISIFKGDITTLEIDSIVNAANKTLLGGGGVDGAIHRAAGPNLRNECETLHGCETGEAKITGGYQLPAKYVIHTVGPVGEKPGLLQQCYKNSLKLMTQHQLRTIAFPCISTGIYGYPVKPAAHIAAYEVRKHLEAHQESVDRVIFCIFLDEDLAVYEGILQSYFPTN